MLRVSLMLAMAMALTYGRVGTAEDIQPPELTRDNYQKTRDYVVPTAQELSWLQIPWRSTFWEGVVEAQGKDKPILLWVMNGHPLACT